MNLIIVGTNGFIGSQLAKHFNSRNNTRLFGIPWSINCLDQIKQLLTNNKIDTIINATGSANVVKSVMFPNKDFEANVLFHFALLDIIKGYDCRYIYFSSAAVYGNPQKLPISETDLINPVSPYGWHKYYGEQMCYEFASLYKVKTASLRLFSVYGPGQKKMLFFDLYNKCIGPNSVIELQGSENDSRDFIYVTDVPLAVEQIITLAPMNGECYNVSSGQEMLISDVAKQFVRLAAPEKTIRFNSHSIPGYPSNWKADIGLISQFGFVAKTSIEQGLKETLQWLKENV